VVHSFFIRVFGAVQMKFIWEPQDIVLGVIAKSTVNQYTVVAHDCAFNILRGNEIIFTEPVSLTTITSIFNQLQLTPNQT